MQEPYREGVVNHSGPESCVVVREGWCEALTGDREGRVLSRERQSLWGASVFLLSVGNTSRTDSTRYGGTPRGRRPRANTEAPHAGTGRSHVRPRKWRPIAPAAPYGPIRPGSPPPAARPPDSRSRPGRVDVSPWLSWQRQKAGGRGCLASGLHGTIMAVSRGFFARRCGGPE